MAGAAIAIEGVSATSKILSVKKRVFAANSRLYVRRQRLVYTAGPYGMDALADDETLGGAGVAHDGSAELDVLLADVTAAEAAELGEKVWIFFGGIQEPCLCSDVCVSRIKLAMIMCYCMFCRFVLCILFAMVIEAGSVFHRAVTVKNVCLRPLNETS